MVPPHESPPPSEGVRWGRCRPIAAVFAVWACVTIVGYVRYLPPAPQPADADADEFSAKRALILLEELIREGLPHPVGSAQNRIVRDRIIARLQEFGYAPEIQTAEYGDETIVENVVARRESQAGGSAIVLVAHYDSVDEGPGASDDGVGVAALLEVARMLHSRPQSRNDVIFLFTDGEEYGALGAESFVNSHPFMEDVAVVLCFDARGTAGPSLMFETSDENAWLIEVLADGLSRPVTSSLFDEVYEYLPTYTDLTPFLEQGIDGYNFAFIRGVEKYHTSEDNLASVTPGSLQHHGQNAWQLTVALTDVDLDTTAAGRAVYTDLFAWCVLWWNEDTGRVWATALPLLMIVLAVCQVRRGRVRPRELLWGGLAVPLVVALAIGAAWLVDRLIQPLDRFESPWSPWALPLIVLYWVICAGVFLPLGWLTLRRLPMPAVWIVVWTVWSLAACGTAWLLSGASYLFLLPATAAMAVGMICCVRKTCTATAASFAGVVAAGSLWLPQQFLFYDALGMEISTLYVYFCAALLTVATPLLAGR